MVILNFYGLYIIQSDLFESFYDYLDFSSSGYRTFLAFLESHYNNEPSFCQPLKPPELTPYVNAQEISIFNPPTPVQSCTELLEGYDWLILACHQMVVVSPNGANLIIIQIGNSAF